MVGMEKYVWRVNEMYIGERENRGGGVGKNGGGYYWCSFVRVKRAVQFKV